MLASVAISDVVWLAGALAWDVFLGEPPNRLHPVVWIGKMITTAERPLRNAIARVQLVGGLVVALGLPCLCALLVCGIMATASTWPLLHLALGLYLTKSTFALSALGKAAAGVRDPLLRGDLGAARVALRSLCSRDPSPLDASELAGSAVSSVAENASDSFVAPLFWFALFGLPGAVFYRVVNTMDAMIGYRGRYEHLGKAAARLDDLLNYVPARLTALLLLAAGALSGGNVAPAVTVWRRDARKTPSPNGGHPMSMMAGLLGVKLTKPGHYALGEPDRRLGPHTIDLAWRLVKVAAALTFVAACAVILCFSRRT